MIRTTPKAGFPESLTLPDGSLVPLDFTINKRARRIILRLEPTTRALKITLPSKRRMKEALQFAHQRHSWIKAQIEEALPPVPFEVGCQVPYKGRLYRIAQTPGRSAHVAVLEAPPTLIVTGRQEHLARRLRDWMIREARSACIAEAERLTTLAGLRYTRLTTRNMKTRWGSCSSEGALCLNWRLIMAPDFVLRYVVAHEVAHLKHMDHSAKFWRLVDRLDPENRKAKAWLERHGGTLWAYGVPANPAAPEGAELEGAAPEGAAPVCPAAPSGSLVDAA